MSREEVKYLKVVCDRCGKKMQIDPSEGCAKMDAVKLTAADGTVTLECGGHADLCNACAVTVKNSLQSCIEPPKRPRKAKGEDVEPGEPGGEPSSENGGESGEPTGTENEGEPSGEPSDGDEDDDEDDD